jgi:GDP-mannose 6-dehydrogenase
LDLKLPLLQSALPSNEEHLQRAIEAVLDLPAKRIGVIGLAFKENTDDLRESPVVTLLEQLIGKGRDVKVFDPHIRLDEIYGANRNFILESIPHIGRLLVSNVDQILIWADQLVLAQKQDAAIMERISSRGLPTVDLVRGALKASVASSALSPTGD